MHNLARRFRVFEGAADGPIRRVQDPRVPDLRASRRGQLEESDLRVLQEPVGAHQGGTSDVTLRVQAAVSGIDVHGGGAEVGDVTGMIKKQKRMRLTTCVYDPLQCRGIHTCHVCVFTIKTKTYSLDI